MFYCNLNPKAEQSAGKISSTLGSPVPDQGICGRTSQVADHSLPRSGMAVDDMNASQPSIVVSHHEGGRREREMTKNVSSRCIPRSHQQNMQSDQQSQIMASIKAEEEKIASIHSHVCNSPVREEKGLLQLSDSTEFVNEAAISLKTMQRVYLESKGNLSEQQKQDFQQRLTRAQSQVQEMNAHAKTVTMQDINNIGTFFCSPNSVGDAYEVDGERYCQPDHSQLLSLASQFMSTNLYAGLGLLLKKKVLNAITMEHQNCDIIYFKKHQDQVDWERQGQQGGVISYLMRRKEKMEEKRRLQAQLMREFSKKLQSNPEYRQWHYLSFREADSDTLKGLGYSEEQAYQVNAMIFYHKKKIEE